MVTALLAVAGLVTPAAARADMSSVSCQNYTIPVALASGQAASYRIGGQLCATPAELRDGVTVQLLIHGATYNRTYWNFGTYDGVQYSYAKDVANAGFPTFAMDEVDTAGVQPTPPPSQDISLAALGFVAHEVVAGLHDGSITGTRFGKVILVGHSFGSLALWEEAINYHDAAGVIDTGLIHFLTNAATSLVAQDFYPAVEDPKFLASGLDPGYFTTRPSTRAALFYNADDADLNVIRADEASKDVASFDEAQVIGILSSTATQAIHVPVLIVMGGSDALFCGAGASGTSFDCSSGAAIASQEAPFYSPQAQLQACSVPGSGHDLNLALNHVQEEADTIAWSNDYVGQEGITTRDPLPSGCS